MMNNKKLLLLLFLFTMGSSAFAQKTAVYTDANLSYKRGTDFYQQGLYRQAQKEFEAVIAKTDKSRENVVIELRQHAELKNAQCAIRLGEPEGEKLILDFVKNYPNSAVANQAKMEMGNYYYNAGKYDNALKYYGKVEMGNLSNEEIVELRFKKGYTYFVRKKYKQAQKELKLIKEATNSDYYQPANYYYGITKFFEDDYKAAMAAFKRVEKSKKYSQVIPYYVTQIAFAEGDYDEVISYGEEQLTNGGIKYTREISQMIGKAYFERGEYAKALPYLEDYANSSSKLRKEDFYQVGYTQYQTGKYKAAIKNFQELNNLNTKLGQNALYNLADCQLKENDKLSARNAFKKAAAMNFDKQIQEESAFNYAKLSYDLKDDKEAIRGLQQVKSSSKNYREAQELLSKVFLNTRNYAEALKILEKIPNKSITLKEAYQKVAYYRGVQLYNDGNVPGAKALFIKSLRTPIDAEARALAHYWIGEINHRAKDYNSSIKDYSEFLTIAKTLSNLPDEASIHTANYAQGYNYLKQNKYETANTYFFKAASGIQKNIRVIKNEYIKTQVLQDAMLRNGDCYFKRNKYTEALSNYNKVISGNFQSRDYALYQKGLILGLQGKTVDKILALETLAEKNKNSKYADDALLALGSTYFEIGKPDMATRMLNNLINRYKGKSDLINPALLKLGLIAYNQSELDKALEYYKQVFRNNPGAKEAKDALKGIEEIYIDRGEPDKYFAFLESIPGYKVSTSAKDSLSFKTAEAQYRTGDYKKAVDAYSSYLRKFPNGQNALEAHYSRGESYFIQKDYGNALIDYEYVIGRGQSRFYTRAIRKAALIAYNFSQDFQKSYDYFVKLEQSSSDQDEIYEAELGAIRSGYRANNEQGVYDMAEKILKNGAATTKDKAEANYYTGKVALNANRLNKAEKAFDNVLTLIDNVWAAESHYQLAYIYYLNRDLAKAQNQALDANQNYPDYSYWLAKSIILLSDIFAEQNDIFNAKASLQSIIDYYEGDDEIMELAKEKLSKIEAAEKNSSRLKSDVDPDGDLELDEGGNR